MRLFIRAVNRPGTNVYWTLAGLASRDPEGFAALSHVHVVSGDGDRAFLRSLEHTNRTTVHYGFDATYEKIRKWKAKRRAAWSYLYFLQLARGLGDDAMVMEDDVAVCNGWGSELKKRMALAQAQTPSGRWALSGYYGFPICPFAGSPNAIETCTTHLMWGNLMTVYPREMLADMHEGFKAIVLAADDMSTDLTVQNMLKGFKAPLYYANPGIAQHAGDQTTLRADGIRRSSVYHDRFKGA